MGAAIFLSLKRFILSMKYNRILLKLSGEALMGDKQFSIDTEKLTAYAEEIKSAVNAGAEVAVVIGGGNIFRGVQVEGEGLDRVQGDYMGMLATIINGMALQSALEKAIVETRFIAVAIKNGTGSRALHTKRAMRHMQKGRVVIFGGGTGNPYFTTDTAGYPKEPLRWRPMLFLREQESTVFILQIQKKM